MQKFATLTTSFEGHAMALSVIGLVLFGRSPNWNDRAGLDKVTDAIIHTGNQWIGAVINESAAFKAGIKAMDAKGNDYTKDAWQEFVAMIAAGLLEEHGGLHGLNLYGERLRKCAAKRDYTALREHLGSFLDSAKERQEPAAEAASEPPLGMFIVDPNGDVTSQLKAQGAPADVVDLLRAAGFAD